MGIRDQQLPHTFQLPHETFVERVKLVADTFYTSILVRKIERCRIDHFRLHSIIFISQTSYHVNLVLFSCKEKSSASLIY